MDVHSIYSRDQGIRMNGLRLHRVCLNRHLPTVDKIAGHAHAHSQILVYLAGAGSLRVGEELYPIRRGSLFYIPPRTRHSFIDSNSIKPLCLALDLKLAVEPPTTVAALTLLDLKQVRRELAQLTRWQTGHERIEPREAAAALRLIDLFLRALNVLDPDALPAGGNLLRTVERALQDRASWRQPLSALARRIGYQPDYLNRVLKAAGGLTLGELRDARRLRAARQGLSESAPVAEVAAEVGFDDPNYFARWFRAQTGYTPTAWRAGQKQKSVAC